MEKNLPGSLNLAGSPVLLQKQDFFISSIQRFNPPEIANLIRTGLKGL
jgi:hypothetical protein